MSQDRAPGVEDAGEYCRQVETYLCRKNDGHLIRIAGPSFTRVCGWAEQGIPLNAVYRGIDRYFERYYSKGRRRRPVQIDFCEADVLDAFDEWRRAVGVFPTAPVAGAADERESSANDNRASDPSPAMKARAHGTLPAHLERVIARLTTMRAGARLSPKADDAIAAAVRELDGMRAPAAHARGEARAAIVARLHALDGELLDVVRHSVGEGEWQSFEDAARDELARFRDAMSAELYARAVRTSAVRLLRERTGLPDLRYDE